MLSTIVDIFKLTNTTRVIENVVTTSDVFNVKQTLSEIDFVRKNISSIVSYAFIYMKEHNFFSNPCLK